MKTMRSGSFGGDYKTWRRAESVVAGKANRQPPDVSNGTGNAQKA